LRNEDVGENRLNKNLNITAEWTHSFKNLNITTKVKQSFVSKIRGRTRVCLLDDLNNLVFVGKDGKVDEIMNLG